MPTGAVPESERRVMLCARWGATKSQRTQVNVRIQSLRQEFVKTRGKGAPTQRGAARGTSAGGGWERRTASGELRAASGEHTTEKGGIGGS